MAWMCFGFYGIQRLFASFGVICGTLLMVLGIWGMIENELKSEFFSVAHFCLFMFGFLITSTFFIIIHSTFKIDAIYLSIACGGMIYTGMLGTFSFGMTLILILRGIGKLYIVLFAGVALISTYMFGFFFKYVKWAAPLDTDSSVSIENV
ncbi:hypothetical protein NPIL_24782 [Nephila pilipes]|uniref:Uncharacterized protein n=1 Tax=Nephila pilipes TaxID=299642 RepID=A0A8X6TUH4_NEPPI|nr:hypothetical protein NPIL_24782 [Nephila pilipes]